MKKRIFALRVLLLALGLLSFCWPALSQVNLGRLGGLITDQTGGVIPGATVTVLDVARGISRTSATDNAGVYAAPNLIPGTYSIRVEKTGFRTMTRQDVTVAVGQDVRVDLTLQPGVLAQEVTVSGEIPTVDTTNAELGGVVQNHTINEIPLNGRNFLYLLQYRPEIQMRPGGGGPNQQNANGLRGAYNVVVFDGLANVLAFEAASSLGIGFIAGGGDQASQLSLDAIQEFAIVTNPKAEYGWRPGAQINIAVKSGTNTLHGSGFAFGRDTSMNGTNAFAQTKAPLEYEDFGGTLGGPIKKDKLFYFFSYEGQRYSVGNPKNLLVPTTVSGINKNTSFPDAIYDILKNHPTVPLSQLSLNLAGCPSVASLNALKPTLAASSQVVCNAGKGLFGNAGPANEFFAFTNTGGTNAYLGKVDYRVNDRHTLFANYYFGKGAIMAPAQDPIQPWWISPLESRGGLARFGWTWTPNAVWLNEFRFGWDRSFRGGNPSADCRPEAGAPDYSSLGFVSGATLCGFPLITITGFANLGQNVGQDTLGDSYRFADSVAYQRGKHQFKFGGEFGHHIFNGALAEALAKGALTFGGTNNPFNGSTPLQNFLTGFVASGQLQIGNPYRTVTFNQFAGYFQDDWRMLTRLTVNLGLRYEYSTSIQENDNLVGSFNPASPTGLVQAPDTLYHVDPYGLSPRIGVVWDITGRGTTVLRSSFNMAYAQMPIVNFFNLPANLQNTPTGWSLYRADGSTTSAGGSIMLGKLAIQPPSGAFASWAVGQPIFGPFTGSTLKCGNGQAPVNPVPGAPARNPNPCNVGMVDPNISPSRVYSWTFGLQRALTSRTTLDASYVGTHSLLLGSIDLNQAAPGNKGNAASLQLRRPFYNQFPYLGAITLLSRDQDANYNALQVALNQQAFHGLTLGAGYTFAHNLDQYTQENNQSPPMDSRDPAGDYGPGDFDVRHRFTFNATYAIPGKKSVVQLLQGWELNSAVTLMSQLPYNAIDSTDNISGTNINLDRWSLFGTATDFSGYGRRTAIPCYGAAGSAFAAAGCSTAVPAPCVSAASQVPTGPTGQTGAQALSAYGCYMVGSSVIVPPAQGTFGNMGRNGLRGPGFRGWDMSVTKRWSFRERLTAQFRAEVFNVLNSVQYATPSNNLGQPKTFGQSQSTPDIDNSSPIFGPGDARRLQLGLRLNF